MTERYLTITQFEDLMQGWFVKILQWGDEYMSPSKTNDVRISWSQSGQPAFTIDEDVVFLKCIEIDNPYNRQREVEDTWKMTSPESFDREISYTRVWQVDLIIYGPESFENAQTIRNKIFYPENLRVINNSHVYLIPDVVAPRRVPEIFQGMWWERTDLSLQFNESVIRKATVPAIDRIEVVIYEGDKGKQIAKIKTE
jgi:hypothetical protein